MDRGVEHDPGGHNIIVRAPGTADRMYRGLPAACGPAAV
jgi:hypothetical protein